ncbi:hypothetical protein Tco_1576170 [Tanacetum coccineum]
MQNQQKSVQSEEPEFEVADLDMPQDQDKNLGNDDVEPKEKVASKRDWFTKPTQPQEPTDPDWNVDNIEDLVTNIWVPVKVAYDKHALWGISHWREQRKSFYGYARGMQSRHDVYSTKHILAVTQVEVMRKHGYRYLKEIVNWLTNLSGDEVSDFAIALRMFTRSLVIQKQIEDLQLGVERRNRLMRSDELYKFNDRTLIGLRTSLDDIKKNIQMEYLPKRRWSTLKKNRANIMIKAIDKQLKERSQNRRDLPRDIPLHSVVVPRYEKRSKSKNKGKVSTEMELVLEQTQQERFNTTAGNPVKEILLKLNLPDHKSILTDSKEYIKMDMKRRSIKLIPYKVLKLKNIKKDGYTRFQYQEQYEHIGPEVTRSQEGKRSQDDDKRLCLVDDLKKFKITFTSSRRYKSKPKVNDHYINS